MKAPAKITIAFLVFISTVGISLARPILIVGPYSYGQGGTATYTYDAGVLIPTLYWQATNGTLGVGSVSGTQYSITVTWSSTATSGIIAVWGNGDPGTQLNSLTVALVSCTGTLPPNSIVAGSRCGAGSVTLSASAPTSDYYVQWYDANMWTILSTGAQGTTSTYTTPSISGTTNYKVTAVFASTGCQSAATTVPATINSVPSITTSSGSQTICNGNSANIVFTNSIPNTTNSWTVVPSGVNGATNGSGTSSGSSPYQYTFSPTLTTSGSSQGTATYTVTPSANGCPGGTATVTITVSPSPGAPPPITQPAAICAGLATSITATPGSGGTNVNWFSTSSGGSPLYTNTTYTTPILYGNTNYYAETFNGSGCPSASRTAVTVTVNAVPAAPVSGTNGSACYMVDLAGTGSVSAVPGSGANTIRWYTGGNQLTPDGLSYQGSTSSSTKYNAYSYNSTTGCQSSTGIIVWLNGNPTPNQPTFNGGDVRCGPGQFNLTATAGSNGDQVKWYDNNHTYKQTGTTYSPIISVSGTVVYATTYNSSTQCESGQKGESVLINPLPSPPTIATPNPMCVSASGTGTINAAAPPTGYGINWYSTSTGGTSFTYGTTYTTPIISAQVIYYLEVVSDVGCASATRTAVTVNPEPIPNNLSSTLVCGSGTSIITGSAGTGTALKFYDGTLSNSYLYTPSPVTSYTTGTISSNQTYYAASYNSSTGCESAPAHRVGVQVTERPVPSVTSSGNQSFCGTATTSVVLTNNLPSTVNTWTVVSSSVGGASASAGTSSSASPYTYTMAQSLSPSGTVPGTATYTVTPSLNGCPGLPITVVATMSPQPSITVSNNAPSFCSAGNTSIAINNTTGLPNTTYSWSLSGVSSNLTGAASATNTSTATITQSLSVTGSPGSVTYVISAATPYCQSATVPATVTVNPVPNASTEYSQTICSGNQESLIIANPNNVSGTNFTWTTASTNASFANATGTGSAIVDVFTNSDGVNPGSVVYTIVPATANCTGTAITATVNVNSTPRAPVTSSYIGYGTGTVTLQTAVPDGLQARWWSDQFNLTPLGTSPALVYTSNSYPSLCLSMKNPSSGCESARTPVSVTFLPAISPDNVTVETVRITGQLTEGDVIGLSTSQKAVAISFLDGLSRTNQVVALNATPLGKDLVRPVEYDSHGRTLKDYLPYPASTNSYFQGTYATDQAKFYNTPNNKVACDSFPYALATYELSPLGRVLAQGQAGKAWQPGQGFHAKQVSYAYNTGAISSDQDEVRQFASDGSSTGFFAVNTLKKATVTDENGNLDIVFKNGVGNTVARKQQATASTWLQTYYIYDAFNRLKYIVPPAALSQLKASGWSVSAIPNFFDTWCFQFSYDNRGRLIQKKTPGQAWTYYAYDKMNRLLLSQDGNLRQQGKWSFVKYDLRGRSVVTGLYTNASLTDQPSAQALVNSQFGSGAAYYESRTSATGFYGYTNQSFPTSSLEVWNVVYFDDYNFLLNNGSTPVYDHTHLAGLPATASAYTRGRVTGGSKLIVGTANMLTSAVFYDDYGRVIQAQGNNHLNLTGLDKTSTAFDFEKATQTKTTHSPDGLNFTTILQTPVYDAQGRISQMKHSINGAPDQIVAQYAYNELGQRVMKQLHNTGSGYLQNVDYRYNIRGWLTSINNAQLANDGNATNGDTNDFFGMEMNYQTDAGNGNTLYYNGNVSSVKWKGAGAVAGAAEQRSYKYTYDQADRLTAAVFQKSTGSDWSAENNTLNEAMTYDLNGNITYLQRKQNQRGLLNNAVTSKAQTIDSLIYTYTSGNQLSKVDDSKGAAGFSNGTNSGDDYAYDSHGNLTQDLNKGINAITYNALGKPQQITFSDGRTVVYTYDAGGNKLMMATTVSGATTTTDYTSGFVYNTVSGTRTLAFISSPEGRVVKNTSGSYEYQYAIADHQGNTRILFTSATPTVQSVTATFETANQTSESTQFSNYGHISAGHASTTPGNSQYLNGNSAGMIGVAKSYKVYPGDQLKIEAYGSYNTPTGNPSSIGSFASALITALSLPTPVQGEIGTASAGINTWGNMAAMGFGDGSTDNTDPKAFVNIVLFDKNYNFLDVAYAQLKGSSLYYMTASYTVKEAGYAYLYVSNEQAVQTDVYFDDVKMTYTPTPVLQASDYYAFGLQHATSWTRDNTSNNFLYDAGGELNNTTGMYDLPNRNYDATVGRFFQVDPLAHTTHDMTPYHYATNNPMRFNDPTGLMHVSDAYVYTPGDGGGGGNGNGPNAFDMALGVIADWNSSIRTWMDTYYIESDGSTTNTYGKDGNLEGTKYVGKDARAAFAAMQQEYFGAQVAIRTLTLNLQMQVAYYQAMQERGARIFTNSSAFGNMQASINDEDYLTQDDPNMAKVMSVISKYAMYGEKNSINWIIDYDYKEVKKYEGAVTDPYLTNGKRNVYLNPNNFDGQPDEMDALFMVMGHEYVHTIDFDKKFDDFLYTKYSAEDVQNILEYRAYSFGAAAEKALGVDIGQTSMRDALKAVLPKSYLGR